MPGMGLETSFAEMAWALLLILGGMVLLAVVAGVLTLPIFYGTLAYKVVWFWSGEASGAKWKRILGKILWVGLPIFSLVATFLSLGYFGALDYPYRVAVGLPSNKMGPVQLAVSTKFDGFMRKRAQSSAPIIPQDIEIKWAKCSGPARELLALWESEIHPPPLPIEQAFPPYENPPDIPDGPPPVPKSVVTKSREIAAKAADGSLYLGTDSTPLTKDEIKAVDFIFDRAMKETKVIQDGKFQLNRGLALYTFLVFGPIPLFVFASSLVFGRRGVVLVMRSLIRALLRTSLTYLSVFVLVFMLCSIWSILDFLSALTAAKDANMKGIITEKFQIPSQMKPSHLGTIKAMLAELPPDQRPDDIDQNIMTWAFVGGTLDPTKRSFQNSIFFFALEPEAILKMMPGLEDLTGEEHDLLVRASKEMSLDKRAVVIGADKLRQMGKRVGDTMKMTSLNYKDIEFDFRIIGEFPTGTRWEQSAVMNRAYLDDELKTFPGRNAGRQHPLADKCMNLIWVRLPNQKAFETLSNKLNDPAKFAPAVKMEIESSAYANFLSPYKTLLSFMRYALAPGLLVITTLVTSLVIGIGVRERRTEIAVLKVLGFRPWMVLGLILGEALLIGTLSGFMATATAYSLINAAGGIPLPIGFFGKFFIPEDALWWGPAIGAATSLIGSILPSINTYRIKASQVFSRVT